MSGAPAPLFLCPHVGYHVSDDHSGSRPAANEVLPDGPISPQTHTDAQYAMLFLADVYSIVLTKRHSIAAKFQGVVMPSCVRHGSTGVLRPLVHVSDPMCPTSKESGYAPGSFFLSSHCSHCSATSIAILSRQ